MHIRILGVSGSPRDGNSLFLLEKALAAARSTQPENVTTQLYSIRGKTFHPCIHCYACQDRLQGECAIEDDFQELRDAWVDADGLIYSVPVYHMSIPGQLKCFFDRLGNSINTFYNHYYQVSGLMASMKAVGSIAQGKHIFSGQEHALTDLINHALLVGAVPVAGDLWEAYIGAAGWTADKRDRDAISALYSSSDLDAQVAVRASESVGKRVAEVCLLLAAGAANQPEYFNKQGYYTPLLRRLKRE